jgi:hypothetical protein
MSIPEKQRKQIEFIDEIYDKIVLKKNDASCSASSNLKHAVIDNDDKENNFKSNHLNMDSLDSQGSQIKYGS